MYLDYAEEQYELYDQYRKVASKELGNLINEAKQIGKNKEDDN